ncbi:MAG: hypothetical protein AMDU1_APLC00020G0076 [Thermoplasmatales archaeon A-plasma]|nr:MAG: hypothetical protein AMDU1_APLC00020G0076 [Thermoplasmatales archaeon A-plasma]
MRRNYHKPNYNSRNGMQKRSNMPKDTGPKKSRRLDMRKTEEFNFMLGKIVEELPDSVRGAVKGSLYSIASKKGTREARDYIVKIRTDGLIDDDMQKRLLDLLADYSKFR